MAHSYSRIFCTGCGRFFDVPDSCGNRFCPVCSRRRAYTVRFRITSILHLIKQPPRYSWRFITLTIPTGPHIRDQFNTINKAFRRLRQQQWWKHRVLGGVSVVEVTSRGSNWHVHLHVLALSKYLPHAVLMQRWQTCSPGSIVWIKLIPLRAAVAYLTQYLTKVQLTPTEQEIASRGLRGVRLYTAFGCAHDANCHITRSPYCCPYCGRDEWLHSKSKLYLRLTSGKNFGVPSYVHMANPKPT